MQSPAKILTDCEVDTSSLTLLFKVGKERVYGLTVPGAAVASWERLRALVPHTGCWPVLLGDEEDLESHRENVADSKERTATLLEQAEVLARDPNPRAWFYGSIGKDVPEDDVQFGPWDGRYRPNNRFSIPYDGGEPRPAILLGLVPTQTCWHVPAILRYGGWNACPPPQEHAALMKHWLERYEAEVVGMTRDVIEMRVGRPPTTRDEARGLARQQYSYCTDIVSQGVETVDALAACLLRGRVWYFWWD
jgi:hypothetical protein